MSFLAIFSQFDNIESRYYRISIQNRKSSLTCSQQQGSAGKLDVHIGLWLLSGAVLWQTVQVFQPSVSTLNI